MKPFFSVIIPTYNRADRVVKTIQTLIDQTFKDWELILVDDGGSDNTKICVENFKDARIKYFWKENGERGAARNFGAEKASGKYYNFFDSDDLMYPFHLQLAHEFLIEKPTAKVLCFPWKYYDANDVLIGERKDFDKDLNQIILKKNFIHLNGGFIKNDLFSKSKFIEDREFKICEDWFFYMKLSLQTKLYGVNVPTFKYIIHENSTMNNMSSHDFIVAIKYFRALFAENKFLEKNAKWVYAELYSMLSLSFSIEGKRLESFRYFWASFLKRPSSIFSKRTGGIIKRNLYAKGRG